jgi:multidrug efflux system membrane fusion protein
MRLRSILLGVLVLAAGGAGVWFVLQGPEPVRADRAPTRAVVPVSVATAARRDMPIYLSGLGTVQAEYTVGIHSQVDGKLLEVKFTEGQHVKKGDVLAKIDPRLYQAALDQAKAKKAQDEAALVAAQKDLERFKTLALKSFETQQNVDQQQAKVDQAKAAIAADDAAIETAQTNLDYTSITAPSDGRIGMRLVDPGNLVRASDQGSIATLVRTQPLAVIFTLPARSLDDVRDAQARGAVEVTAFDQDNRKMLGNGQLLLIDNLIDPATATIRLKAMFPNADETLWPGEFVNARLLVETRTAALTVPSTAIQRGPDGLFTWVIGDNNVAQVRKIAVGPATGDVTIITSGITDGERVVTDGQYKLQKNSPVSITNAAPTPPPARIGSAS